MQERGQGDRQGGKSRFDLCEVEREEKKDGVGKVKDSGQPKVVYLMSAASLRSELECLLLIGYEQPE